MSQDEAYHCVLEALKVVPRNERTLKDPMTVLLGIYRLRANRLLTATYKTDLGFVLAAASSQTVDRALEQWKNP